MSGIYRGTEIFTTYKEAAEAIRSGDEEKIRDLQRTFQNLSPEEQNSLQTLIDEVIQTSEAPTREHLATLRETMLMYEGLGTYRNNVTPAGGRNISAFNLSNLESTARQIIDSNIETRNDREVFLYQSYINTVTALNIKVDGIVGPETRGIIINNVRATQIFLQELGVEGIFINGTLDAVTISAIKEKFGAEIDEEANAESSVIEIPHNQIRTLALQIIGEPLTEERIRQYQVRQGISADGLLGNETYFEMKAGEVHGVFSEDFIERAKQQEVLQILQNGNPQGRNYIYLLLQISRFRETHEEDEAYRVFNTELDSFFNNPDINPFSEELQAEADEAINTPNRSGGTIGGDLVQVFEGNMEFGEFIQRNKGRALVLTLVGFIFFGNHFPGMSRVPGTGSFLGRIGWAAGVLIGGPMLGLDELLGYGVNQIMNSRVAENIRSWFDGTSGNVRERILEVRNQEGNELHRLFPNQELLDQTLTHFEVTEGLNTLSLDNLQGYIDTLRSGETETLPDFLKNITINGQSLSNEQVAIILESFIATMRESDETIGDTFLSTLNPLEIAGGGASGLGLIVGAIAASPVIATVSVVVGGVTYFWGDELWQQYLQANNPFFSESQHRIQEIISSINNETVVGAINAIPTNIPFETKVARLQEISNTHTEFQTQISELIDLVIERYITELTEGIEAIENIDGLETTRGLLSGMGEIITRFASETQKARFSDLVGDGISQIDARVEVQRIQEVRQAVTTIEQNIVAINNSIESAETRRQELETQLLTASVEDLMRIQRELSEIPGEIAELEMQRGVQQGELSGAQETLANIEVEIFTPTVAFHITFLTEPFENAVTTQGIVPVTNLNITRLIGIENQLGQIEAAIASATENAEKTVLLASISEVRRLLEAIKTRYQAEYPTVEITAESLRAQNFDLTTQQGFLDFQSLYAESITFRISEENTTFLGVRRIPQEEVTRLFREEFIRQILAVQEEFVGAPVNNIQSLRNILQRRQGMLDRYTTLFQMEYEDTEFQYEIERKREEIENLNIWSIEGFNDFYTETIEELNIDETIKNVLFRVREQDISFLELRNFFTVIVANGINGWNLRTERLLSGEVFENIANFITLS